MSFALFALGAVGLVAAQASETPKLTAECLDTVIFFARGNDAPYHDGRTTPFLDATCAKLVAEGKTCDYIDVQYDVTLGGPYCTQVAEGDANGISQITAFQAKCPCTHLVLGGYSEGANVMGDVLGGGGCLSGSTGIDRTSAAGKAIAAAVVWGDPRHTANQPYNVLDGASLQASPRDADSLARLNAYASVLRNYCGAGDPICAGGDNVTQHLDYFDLYTDDAATWVVGKVDAAAALCDATSSSSVGATAASSSAGPIAANSPSIVVSIATPTAIKPTAIAIPTGANASTVTIPVVVNTTSISTVDAVPVVVSTCTTSGANATSVVAPIYANSSVASTATAASFPLVNGYTTVYPTTIRTVVSANAIQSNGGYTAAYPTTILTVVSVTSTRSEYATVTGAVVPSQETKGYAASPPVVPAPAPESPAVPKAPKAPSPAPQVSQKPSSSPLSACEVVTTTVYV